MTAVPQGFHRLTLEFCSLTMLLLIPAIGTHAASPGLDHQEKSTSRTTVLQPDQNWNPDNGLLKPGSPSPGLESVPGMPTSPRRPWNEIHDNIPGNIVTLQDPSTRINGKHAGAEQAELVNVLVFLDRALIRESEERKAVRKFAVVHDAFIKYEYTAALPNALNIRNINRDKLAELLRMRGVARVVEDEYHERLVRLDESTPLINALQSQIISAGHTADGSGIRVCVADTGIDMDHIMYDTRIDTAASFDFVNNDSNPDDDFGHGAHVAGIAVGGTGITVDLGCDGTETFQGVAPNATLIGAKILNQFGGGSDSDIIAGIDYCADQSASGGQADVINLSIGTGDFSGNCTHSWAVASNNAAANGVVVVAASGNENNTNSMGSPACGADVIAVGATYKVDYPNCEEATSTFNWTICTDSNPSQDQVVCFSNESDLLDVTAPGSVILSASTDAGGTSIVGQSGTSMASPMVAGLAALILDLDNSLTPAEVRQIIRDGAIDMGPAGFDRAYGHGRIDIVNTLDLVQPCVTNNDCSDGDPCTTDICTAGSCANTPISCGAGQVCIGGTCIGEGACCLGTVCSIETTTDCTLAGGSYQGDGSDCGSGQAGNPTTYAATPNLAIPDGGGPGNPATHVINVPDPVTIGDVDFGFEVTHTWVGDLTVSLSHGGMTVVVIDRPGVPASQFGCQQDDYDGITLDDEATGGPIEDACTAGLSSPPGYIPASALSAFDGMNAAGDWTITVFDSATPDNGTLVSWSVHIDAVAVSPCSGCSVNADCDDGDACNGTEVCNAGNCENGTTLNCDDANLCTDDSCDPASGCVNTDNTAACDDGDACTTNDTCAAGACQGGAPPECDDANICTDDSCDPASGCINTDNTAACDDGDACTTNDTCAAGSCQGGAPPDCDDANICTDDSCVPASGCINTDNTAACDDGDACTTNDTCAAGSCQGGAPQDCDDANICTDDSCDPASGCINTDNTAACDDGDACTTNDTCTAGACQGGAPPECDDANICTVDSCDPASGCVNTDNTAACDDGDACTTNDTCAAGSCQGGAPPDCDDANICTDDSCDPASGCVNTDNTAACDDGDACTTHDTCAAGSCQGGAPPDCDDANICTDDSCDPASGCVNTDNTAACDDGDACTTNDTCTAGTCQGGAPPNCDDANLCTDDSCDPASGCINTDNTAACDDGDACTTNDTCAAGSCQGGAPPDCDDANICTDDSCDPASGCVNTDNTAACDDGDACTTNDTCAAGSCQGGAPPDCDDANICTDDSCDPASGCVNTDNTAACDDGDACTTNDTCAAGACQGGAPPDCDDANLCTDDSCDPASGCVNTDNTAACDDGDACTTNDTCAAGACQGGAPPDCDDANICTDDSCDPASGCVNTDNTAACDDGDACTTNDTCTAGACQGGTPPDCDDANICTDDSCDPASGCVNTDNTAACDDGDACTTNDTCAAGACQGGAPPECDDANICTDDSCDPASGCINTDNTAACDDGDACTTNDTCAAGACQGGAPPDCDDANICTDDSCDPASGCVNFENNASCDDGSFCNGFESCTGGVCQPGIDPCPDELCDEMTDQCTDCIVDSDCNDSNSCTDDFCVSGSCSYVSNSDPCDDGLICTEQDTCQDGSCSGTPVPECGKCGSDADCDDANPCTDETCPSGTCVYTFNNAECDDDNACTTGDTCVDGICLGGPLPDCDDGNPCTIDGCNPSVGCEHTNNTGSCDDGDVCSTDDACVGGVCIGGTVLQCDDDNVCTIDSCDAILGCINDGTGVTTSCNDNNSCTNDDACIGDEAGTCAGNDASSIDCDDENACTTDTCDPDDGCSNQDQTPNGQCCDPISGTLTAIDDGLDCTDDFCNLDGTVDHVDTCPPGEVCHAALNTCFAAATADLVAIGLYHLDIELSGGGDLQYALHITGDPANQEVDCVSSYVQPDHTLGPAPFAQPIFDWGTPIMIEGGEVIPGSLYTLTLEGESPPPASEAATWPWGDVNGNLAVNFEDVLTTVLGFQGTFTVPLEQMDLDPCGGNGTINFVDIQLVVFAFQGQLYGDTGCPIPCTTTSATRSLDRKGQLLRPAVLTLQTESTGSPNGTIVVNVFVHGVSNLNAFQLSLDAHSCMHLESISIEDDRDDFVFGQRSSLSAIDQVGGRAGAILMTGGVGVFRPQYLATFAFQEACTTDPDELPRIDTTNTMLLDGSGNSISFQTRTTEMEQ